MLIFGIFMNLATMMQFKLSMRHLSSNARDKINIFYKNTQEYIDNFKL